MGNKGPEPPLCENAGGLRKRIDDLYSSLSRANRIPARGYFRESLAGNRDSAAPFSFWKSKFQVAPPPAAEAMPKESVEELLRRLVTEDLPEHLNARYVLAILLERKRTLKQVDIRETAEEKILVTNTSKLARPSSSLTRG